MPTALPQRGRSTSGQPPGSKESLLRLVRGRVDRGPSTVSDLAQPLVGRDRELEGLAERLREACAGSQRFAFITGEPGIGKTRLLLELLHRAEDRGALSLRGRASEFESALPFGPLVDALDEYLESLDPREFSRLAAEDLRELAAVFPALRSHDRGPDRPTTAAERFRAHRA